MTSKPIFVLLTSLLACASAHALKNPCNGTFDDSTCVGPNAIRTMVFPTQTVVNKDTVCAAIGSICDGTVTNDPNPTGVPAGYQQITVAAGPHFVDATSQPTIGYYQSLDYPTTTVAGGPTDINTACAGNLTPRIIGYSGTVIYATDDSGAATTSPPAHPYAVCEPLGSHTTLVKTVSNETLTLTTAAINAYAISGSIGVNTAAQTAICVAKGYVGVTPGSVTSWSRGSGCSGDTVTQWSGTGWVLNSACYNMILTGEQCYK